MRFHGVLAWGMPYGEAVRDPAAHAFTERMRAQEAKVYRQATIDQEGSNPNYPKFFWDNVYPGVELLLSQLDAPGSDYASAVRIWPYHNPTLTLVCAPHLGAQAAKRHPAPRIAGTRRRLARAQPRWRQS